MIRWVCPNCGAGVNAPERPRRNDVRRYCLDCSKTAGVLVERTAPKLERRRAAGLERSRARAHKKAQAKRERWVARLLDANGVERELAVKRELRRALTEMGWFEHGLFGRSSDCFDDIEVVLRRRPGDYHSGHAWGDYRVAFTFGKWKGAYESALRVIYHEAVHLAGSYEEVHGLKFHRMLADALQGRWPFLVYGSLKPGEAGGCWLKGRRIDQQLSAYTRSGGELSHG